MLCLLGFQLADVLSGGDAHFLFEDPAEIEGIPVAGKGGNVLNGGDALLHQFTGPLDPEGFPEKDRKGIWESRRTGD